jgi:hypothetical protein
MYWLMTKFLQPLCHQEKSLVLTTRYEKRILLLVLVGLKKLDVVTITFKSERRLSQCENWLFLKSIPGFMLRSLVRAVNVFCGLEK